MTPLRCLAGFHRWSEVLPLTEVRSVFLKVSTGLDPFCESRMIDIYQSGRQVCLSRDCDAQRIVYRLCIEEIRKGYISGENQFYGYRLDWHQISKKLQKELAQAKPRQILDKFPEWGPWR